MTLALKSTWICRKASLNGFVSPLTSHFIGYTLLVPGWTPFWTALILVHDVVMQLLHICQLHIYNVTLPFHYIL